MRNVTYLSAWKPELCIDLDTEGNDKADFNRLLFKHCPSTSLLQQARGVENAYRESFIIQLKCRFDEAIEEGKSHNSLYTIFRETFNYLKWCDEQNAPSFTQLSLEGYMSHLDSKVMLGLLKSSTYGRIRSNITVLFAQYLELPHYYFDNVVIRGKSDLKSFEAYTRSDLNQLLPFLRQLFKQTQKQFIEAPERHIKAYISVPTMIFEWQGQQYKLCGAISKMMCAGTYLLAYYTYANTGDLFQLKRPDNASMTMGEVWYTMPAFKRRAFKTIQVEMGGHELEIPKYALDFFDKLLIASKLIDDREETRLLQTIVSEKAQPMKNSTLQGFLKRWVEKHFTFTNQTGHRLRPVVSRFRETGSQLTAYHQGELANNVMLNNTSSVRKKHYSRGSRVANNGMMQDAMDIREEQIKSKVNTKQAQENLDIKVLVIEREYKINIPNLSRTPNGGSCASPFGEKSKKYTKKAQARGLTKKDEQLACADLLECFGCPDQVIVQSVADIWCLLSFKECIEESLYVHLDASHYRKNFEAITQFIEQKILPHLDKKILKLAESKLDNSGFHPAWSDSSSVLSLIPNTPEGTE
ncbi:MULTISPECIES: hypothetical protein [Photobacterium]|uniref:hypothetical protein n=1 Tax=Photobacterium TaxID=657 RepID=UPI000D160236|nr:MULTISPECIES: hypothetical protein [Photobacterium]PSW43362.1 hypothetical protein C0W40_12095 [Photobacterium leiognathi subsp. mandapamensis]